MKYKPPIVRLSMNVLKRLDPDKLVLELKELLEISLPDKVKPEKTLMMQK